MWLHLSESEIRGAQPRSLNLYSTYALEMVLSEDRTRTPGR
jgi:hypothetical protein